MKGLLARTARAVLLVLFAAACFANNGVVATKSGLKYQDVVIGSGLQAEVGKIAVIHVTGWLEENGQKGREFICSRDLGRPVSFKVGTQKVMQAWNIGVAGMRVGGKRTLMVPAELGYGAKGVQNMVPPNADLIIELELLKVE
jgi:peptidylprolyl isomerase